MRATHVPTLWADHTNKQQARGDLHSHIPLEYHKKQRQKSWDGRRGAHLWRNTQISGRHGLHGCAAALSCARATALGGGRARRWRRSSFVHLQGCEEMRLVAQDVVAQHGAERVGQDRHLALQAPGAADCVRHMSTTALCNML